MWTVLAAVKTMLVHYKLMNDAAVDRSLLPQGHEAQLVTLLSNLIGALLTHGQPCEETVSAISVGSPAQLLAHLCWSWQQQQQGRLPKSCSCRSLLH